MIQPGRVGKLTATMDTSELSGLIGKGIAITTNDPHTPKRQVVIRARILGSVEVAPGKKAILSNRQAHTRSAAFLIRKEADEVGELEVGAIRASVPWIRASAEFIEARRDMGDGLPTAYRGDWLLVATLKGDMQPGRTQEWVKFATGLPREPDVTLQLATDLHPPVILNNPNLTVVAGQPQVVLASLRQDLDQQPVALSAPEGLSAHTEPGMRRFFKIVLEWSGEPPAGPLDLRMDVAGETYTVPVTVTAAP